MIMLRKPSCSACPGLARIFRTTYPRLLFNIFFRIFASRPENLDNTFPILSSKF